jgi:serine/threonine-protein kinase
MNTATPCPSELLLRRFAIGLLPEVQAQAIRPHLSKCPACRQIVDDVQGAPETLAAPTPLDPSTRASESPTQDLAEPHDDFKADTSFLLPSANPQAIGRIGTCDVLELLGRGGMGLVFKAFDSSLQRMVAIKVLSPAMASSRKAHRRFLREARAVAGINHPNVVTIYAVDEQRGMPYLVMEYVAGRTLADRLRQGAPFDLATLLRIAAQVASGLDAAHQHGVIHRDVKPANILLEDGIERAKLTDFGLALVALDASQITSVEQTVGTPAYMSPEQVRGERLDPRSDLFSLGCVLYAMVTGKSPFHGSHVLQVGRMVTEYSPRPLHQAYPNFPRFLSEIIGRLLAKRPDDRFPSAAALHEALLGHLAEANQKSSEVALDLTPAPPKRRRSRLWWPAAAVALLAACLAVLRGMGWWPGVFGALTGNSTQAQGRELRVSQAGNAEYRRIGDALAKAHPGDTIRVVDNATYVETLVLNDRDRWEGITVVAERQATIRSPDKGKFATITLQDTPGVTMRGLQVSSPANQHGIWMSGDLAGVTIEDVHWTQDPGSEWANVYFAKNSRGTAARPIRVRHCDIQSGKFDVYLGGGDCVSVNHVEFEACWLRGRGTHIFIDRPVKNLMIRGNVFVGGAGLSLVLPEGDTSSAVEVCNNTFFQTNPWLSLQGPGSLVDAGICNNLIVASDGFELRDRGLETLVREVTFRANWWEPAERTNLALARRVAEVQSKIDLLSRTAADSSFLRPPTASPLGKAGVGGKHPEYVGAFPPSEAPMTRNGPNGP